MELLDYEKEHIDYFLSRAQECTLFLKRNDAFPCEMPKKVALFGNGARNTIKGGTGSGDVDSRFFESIEKVFENAGIEVTTKEWLDAYEEDRKTYRKAFVKETKKLARKEKYLSMVYSMGFFDIEHDYTIPCDKYDGDICVYVLSRNSGEGNDRRNIEGDVKLSKKEVSDILFLNSKFEKFVLVLNVGGVVDLSPVLQVGNILYLSQLGVATSQILLDILLGKKNPSGKLTTTWGKYEDYPSPQEFGNLHDTYYKEGIYVGYRYFDSVGTKPFFPFGYGLSYTNFSLSCTDVKYRKGKVTLEISVQNTGNFAGKEVVQVYVSKPDEKLSQAKKELVSFVKTKELNPGESESVKLELDVSTFASYVEGYSSWMLLTGDYVLSFGNSSDAVENVCVLTLKEDIVVEKLSNKCVGKDFEDFSIAKEMIDVSSLPSFDVSKEDVSEKRAVYDDYQDIDPVISSISDEELMLVCLGQFGKGAAAIVGESSKHVVGAAGETTNSVPSIQNYLTMADGPAGIRILQHYGVDEKGVYNLSVDPIMRSMMDFLPKFIHPFFNPPKNRHGKVFDQYTTAIPIGTALAQSFNLDFVREAGELISDEMDRFGVDLWLAPALNIHRNILCGRNFEYYSEDPLVSGKVASAMTLGVQKNPKHGVTIKHFCCNNQELNRNNHNAHLSERALREIYLRGFEICIKEANPKALMTSYNLLNGTHTSENKELITDILRSEWGYTGLIMTDWISSGRSFCYGHKYPAPYASNNVLAGNDLTMPGAGADMRDMKKALKRGKLTRDDLLKSATRIYRAIEFQKKA